jgi:hypothetical protein
MGSQPAEPIGAILRYPLPVPKPTSAPATFDRSSEAFVEQKQEAWLECRRRFGPTWGIRVGEALRQEAKRLRPDWPTARERRADLAMHLKLIDALQRTPRPDR